MAQLKVREAAVLVAARVRIYRIAMVSMFFFIRKERESYKQDDIFVEKCS